MMITAALLIAFLSVANSFVLRNVRSTNTLLRMSSKESIFPTVSKWVSAAVISCGIACGGPTLALADAVPLVGADAPSFTLPSNAGKDISLEDLKGKWTVMYFYPGDFTSGCTIEAKAFERDFAKYKELGAQILGVSVDSVEKHLDFGKKYGLEFSLLSDQGGAVSNKYGSLLDFGFVGKFSNRQTYIISPDLKVKSVFTDVDSHLGTHSQDVLKELQNLVKA